MLIHLDGRCNAVFWTCAAFGLAFFFFFFKWTVKQSKEKLKSLFGETAARIPVNAQKDIGGSSCKPISQLPNSPVRAWRLGMVGWGLGGSCYHELARLCISFNSIPTVHRAAMYLREACSLLPFWALLWPKKAFIREHIWVPLFINDNWNGMQPLFHLHCFCCNSSWNKSSWDFAALQVDS